MTNLREDLELIEVVYQNDNKKAVLTFLDEEEGQVLEVNFNKQSYDPDKGEFIDDEEKAQKVDEWCQEYFESDFESLSLQVGAKKDVYCYERFNSLWETQVTERFTKEDEGKIFETEITRITDDGRGIHIYFENEGKEYESKMMYSDYIEVKQQWFVNPQKQEKQYSKFEDKFGVSITQADELVGKSIMVEVKLAFKKFPYADIKKPSWR